MPAHNLHPRHAHLHAGHPIAELDERAALPEPEANPDVKTVISVVYYTAPKTFDGPAVWVTDSLSIPSATESVSAAENTAEATKSSSDDGDDDETTSSATHKPTAKSTGTTLATQTIKPSKTAEASDDASSSATSQITSAADLSSSASLKLSQATSASLSSAAAIASASSTAAAAGSSSSGMSGGAKAGMAFAIISFIALVGFLAFFYRKKQQEKQHQPIEDEKYNEKSVPPQPSSFGGMNGMNNATPIAPMAAVINNNSSTSVNSGRPGTTASRAPSVRTVKTAGNAPRLSLRPMTQFNPMQKNEGDILDTPVGVSPWEKRGAANAANDPANPFGNHAETVDMATARDAVELCGTPTTPSTPAIEFPFPAKIAPTSAPRSAPTSAPTSVPTSAPAPGSALITAVATATVPKHISVASDMSGSTAVGGGIQSPNPFADKEVPPSPGPAPTGPVPIPGSAPNAKAVHRCHMDFTPSMSDELGVTNGQLVRIMHEYDDGWALCQKMDGSQQGVVPRSCLSKQPLKARPGPPPAGGRPPMSPAQGAPRARRPSNASANGVPILGQPRPLSPATTGRNSPGPHSMSPAQGPAPRGPPQGRSRAQSNASFAGQPRPMSPAGGRNSPGPRSMSPMNPAGSRQRSQSNASFTAPRPQFAKEAQRPRASSTGAAGRGTPPGPSPMNPAPAPGLANGAVPQRKPVPGQAL